MVTFLEKEMQDRLATKADIESLRKDFTHGLETLSKDITIKLGSIIMVAAGILIAAYKVLH